MVNKTISLPEELIDKLGKEENASALISKLLFNHYRLNASKIEEIEEQQKQIEEERKKFVEKYSDDYAILETRKKIIQKQEETEEEQKARQKRKREEQIKNVLDYFKEEIGREMTKEELSDYLYRFENESSFSFFKFIAERKENEI